jgi:putative hemolysin
MLMFLAIPFRAFILITWPLVALMNLLSQMVLRVLGIPIASEAAHAIGSPEEYKILFEQSEQVGALEESERLLLSRSLNLRAMNVANLMVHASDVEWLDLRDSQQDLIQQLRETRYTRLPVANGNLDEVLGYVTAKDVLTQVMDGKRPAWKQLIHKLMIVPESRNALLVLRDFQKSDTDMAMVMDEYGGVRGLVTVHNVLKAFVGALPDELREDLPKVVSHGGGVWVVDGTLPLDDLFQITGPFPIPSTRNRFYTLAGLIINELERIPAEHDVVQIGGYKFEVVQMENNRIARVKISRASEKAPEAPMSHPKVA